MSKFTLHRGDAWDWLRSLPSESAQALVTDPPYSSGGFTRGDRQADPQAKYRASGLETKAAQVGQLTIGEAHS